MLSLNRWKIFVILAISLSGLLLSLPALLGPSIPFPSWFPQRDIVLGLDLRGGAHLLLEVDQKKLIADRYGLLLDQVRKVLRTNRIGYLSLMATDKGIRFNLRNLKDFDQSLKGLRTIDPLLQISLTGEMVRLGFDPQGLRSILADAVERSIPTIRRRVDETGTKEPLIQSQGEGRIVLQIPGLDDPAHIKDLLGKTAQLRFQMVEKILPSEEASSFSPDPEHEVLPSSKTEGDFFYVVNREVVLSGDSLVDSRANYDENGKPAAGFVFDRLGAQKFSDITRDNGGRQFAIVLDGEVICAPHIREPITGGSGVITGSFTVQQAQDLCLLMRSGALPAPLVVLEERTVGPGLGSDSITQGTNATIIAIVCVAMLLILFYSYFSVFANIAMLFNVVLLITGLIYLGASLTLPGIAGIALTMGMAVDANVLINERIKEELRLGRKLIPAIDLGYQRAMSTIIDSNLTTLIGAILLCYFGTGPIRGFGVTLTLGIVISMFTAVSLSRVFVYLWLKMKHPKTAWL